MNEKKPHTILIVDDDVDFREQMQFQLEAAGFQVLAAAGREPAEEILRTTRPDLAVLDLMMEQIDGGFALAYHIKKMDPTIPVVLVTGVTGETGYAFDAQTAEEKSWIKADALLGKPVRFEQLLSEIKKLLSR